MNVENKFARIMRNSGPARFFVPVGIILIVFGVILLGFKSDKYLETKGVVTSVTEGFYDEDDGQQYDVDFTYTVDGKEYEGTFSGVTDDYKEGDEIKVYYDPADPLKTSNGKMPPFIPPVMIALGAAAVVFGVFKTVKAFKKSRELDESAGEFPKAAFEGFKSAPGVTEYYYRFDGNGLKPGYILEDADRNVLYEGKMTKQALVGARPFEFVNHKNGITESHDVGHMVTQTYNEEVFSARSYFKFDGENVWDVIHNRGIRISTNLRSKFPNVIYEAAKDGAPFARIESTGMYVHEDDAAQHKINPPAGGMYYRVWTNTSDFDTLFLTVFAISETDQVVVE